jgi:iron-sulfur cluster repair protein YtfE (RIC family)
MPGHLEEFQKDHLQIQEAVRLVKEKGISTREGKELLFSIKDMLVKHLKSEDTYLYPVLREAGKSDIQILNTMNVFMKDMDTVVKQVEDFYAKYTAESSGFDFARSFGALCAVLTNRINREESILYKEYENSLQKTEKT